MIIPIHSIIKDNDIINLLFNKDIKHISIIKSNIGEIRSNHYHTSGFHYLYMISGKMEYYEKDLDGYNESIYLCGEGTLIYTPALKLHKTVFLKDSIMLNMTSFTSPLDYSNNTVKQNYHE